MYIEFNQGWIEVITGPMFSGKSEELIKRIKNLGYANIKTLVVKPKIDSRWDPGKIISRAGSSIKTIEVSSAKDILKNWNQSFNAIAIDEVQFFDKNIIKIISELANKGKRVIVSGLDLNYLGQPFGFMPEILALAEFVSKQKAVCFVCGKAASLSYKKNRNDATIISIGNSNYEARCRSCFNEDMK